MRLYIFKFVMGFIARNLVNPKRSFLFHPLEVRKENNLLKVKVLDGKRVDPSSEYEMFFSFGEREYHLHAKPVDTVGGVVLLQIKDIEEHKGPKFGTIKVNLPILLCEEESGLCIRGVCEEFSLEGAKVKLPDGIDEDFLNFLEEKRFMELVFDKNSGFEEEIRLHGMPTEVDLDRGEVFFLFSLREENKRVVKVYDRLMERFGNNSKG